MRYLRCCLILSSIISACSTELVEAPEGLMTDPDIISEPAGEPLEGDFSALIGEARRQDSDCETALCLVKFSTYEGVCSQDCYPEEDPCFEGAECQMTYAGYACVPTEPSAEAECGNGEAEEGEDCDGGPNCEVDCTLLAPMGPVCGNNIIEGAEACDGGPDCDLDCTLLPDDGAEEPVCGNRVIETGEACDGGPDCDFDCTPSGREANRGW